MTEQTTPEPAATPVAPAMPQIDQVKARIAHLEQIRDQKIANADKQATEEIAAIRERHKQEQKNELDATRARQKAEKAAARENCKNAVASWSRVLKGLEAEKKAAEAAEAAAQPTAAEPEPAAASQPVSPATPQQPPVSSPAS